MIIDIVLGRAIGRGGLENVLSIVSNGLNKRGHRVRICQISEPDYLDWAETLPEIYYFGKEDKYQYEGNIDVFHYALGYQNLISEIGKPDIVLATHTPPFSLLCRLALSFLGSNCPPIISWLHGPPESYGGEEFLQYSDAHLANSYSLVKKIRHNLDNNSPIYFIGHPVANVQNQLIIRPKDKFEILYVGRLNNVEKRLDVLFNALSRITGDWSLRIIGEGPNRNELNKLASQLQINQYIVWDGWKEDPWASVKSASVLVLSSDYEGFGLVLVEALLRGLPVISTMCDGPKEIIQSEQNGWLYPIGDANALEYILQNILDGKVELPEPMVCRESVLHYRPEAVINQLEEVLQNYVNKNKTKEQMSLLTTSDLPDTEIIKQIFNLVTEENKNIDMIFSMMDKNISNNTKSKWLTHLGVLCLECEQLDFVIPAFQKALEYVPNNNEALFNLGFVLRHVGQQELALQYFEKIVPKTDEVHEQINQIRTHCV